LANERKIVEEKIRRILLKEYLMKKTSRAGFGGLDIQRTPMGYRVTLVTERPGLVIGRKGATIKALTRAVEAKFGFENPQIEVQEVENASLNPQIMAEKLASALERGWHFRRAGHSTVRRIMQSGAKGCLVVISGKITGRRHRMEKFKAGHIKFCGDPKQLWMKEGFAVAKVKLGIIGTKVQIMDPRARLPDEIDIVVLGAEAEEPAVEEQDAVEEPPETDAESTETQEAQSGKDQTDDVKAREEPKEVENGTAEDKRDTGDEQRGEAEEA
jgi:small subunit ribosomal protein S3